MFASRTPRLPELPTPTRRRRLLAAALAGTLLLTTTACGTLADTGSAELSAAQLTGELIADTSSGDEEALWDSEVVHDIEIEFDQDEYDAMIETYETTEDKDWIEATVTIDGVSYDTVGLRLKGNSSLRGVTTTTAENPEELPWLIRLDKFVDDQDHQGYTDIVIRSNSTETALNEAVAVELLAEAGLATQEAVSTTLSVNGGGTELRLAMQNPDDVWEEENFDSDSAALYKAESTGDYSYRGDDPESYTDVFDQEAGDDDLEPLMDFLDFINNADDEAFSAELADHLDVESFATYLAFQDLIGNADDIDGRGNNSYLHYDYDTGLFTVVNWDLNLAFGTANVGDAGGRNAAGDGAGAAGPGQVGAAGGERPTGPPPGAIDGVAENANAVGAPNPGGNVLVDRFLADETFAQLYDTAVVDLTETLFADGTAASTVQDWVDVLQTQDVVDDATVESDAAAVLQAISST